MGGCNIACDGLSWVHTSVNGAQIIKTVHSFLKQGLGKMFESKTLTEDRKGKQSCGREAAGLEGIGQEPALSRNPAGEGGAVLTAQEEGGRAQ